MTKCMSFGRIDMDKTMQTHKLTWQNIEIEVTYKPLEFGMIAWLEIKSISPKAAPLPITETGYLSHYHQSGHIEAQGGDAIAFVMTWLDKEAKKPEWQKYSEKIRQYDLF